MPSDDLTILRALLDARGDFGHREHLELAWTYLRIHEPDEARRAMSTAIQHVAESHGASDKFHETLTRGWVHLVAVHAARSDATTFDDFIAANPDLLNRHLLDAHYSPELMWSARARAEWIEPDLRALPRVA